MKLVVLPIAVGVLLVAMVSVGTAIGADRQSADRALAKRLTLRLADLPAGWTVQTTDDGDDDEWQCVPRGLRTTTADAESPRFQGASQAQTASSSTSVYSSPSLAKRAYSHVLSTRFADCALRYLQPSIKDATWKMTRASFRPNCGTSRRCPFTSGKWRFTLTAARAPKFPVYMDMVVVRKSRTVIAFLFSDLIVPPSSYQEQATVRAVATR